MTTQHTPGPWTFERDGTIRAKFHNTDTFPVASVKHAEVAAQNGYDNEFAANARLIAAAPEMLAALKAIIEPDNGRTIEFVSKLEYYRSYIEGGELERARAAIAKAEGG